MSKKKVLIITHTGDNECIDTVSRYIHAAGGETVRFDADCYPLSVRLSTRFRDGQWKMLLEKEDVTCELQDVTAVWYRRSHDMGKGLTEVIDREFIPATMQELRRTLAGMVEGLPCFQMERYSTYRRLDSKEEQLKVAARQGLLIPPTCISNSPEQVKNFIRQLPGPAIAKMQSAFAIYREGKEHVVFTNEVGEDDLQGLDTLGYCPMVFQQKIAKKLELRVTIVGQEIFAFSIDSQKEPNAQTDWRKEGVTLLNDWQPVTLPAGLQKQLLGVMKVYGLNYGAIDLILSPDDAYYFLELNPAGEYFWLDRLCDHAISRQIATVLLGDAPRNETAMQQIYQSQVQ